MSDIDLDAIKARAKGAILFLRGHRQMLPDMDSPARILADGAVEIADDVLALIARVREQEQEIAELRQDDEWLDEHYERDFFIRAGRSMIGVANGGWLWSQKIEGFEERAGTFREAVRAARTARRQS